MQGITGNAGGMDNSVDNTISGGLMDWGDRGINSVLDPMNLNGMLSAGRNDIMGMYGAGIGEGEQGYARAVAAGNQGLLGATAAGNLGLNNAQNVATQGYNQAQGYVNPYAVGGNNAFNQWQGSTGAMGNNINSMPNMGQQQWQQAQQNPQQYYQSIMQGYQMSPQAQYAQQVATRSGNAAAAASGMMGSGAFVNGMQRNANQISQGDQQQYFNNVMGANTAQMGQLQNYQNAQQMYNGQLNNQAGMGYGASGIQSQNAINNGLTQGGWNMQNGQNQGGWNMQNGQNIGNWATNNAAGQMALSGQTGANLAKADGGMLGNIGSIVGAVGSFL